MESESNEVEIASRLKGLKTARLPLSGDIAERFIARLTQVASHPESVPIRFGESKIEARNGGTVMAAALKNGVRLMHACGAKTICSTCRVKVVEGADNLTPMSAKERLSLRYHLSVSPRVRLACQARVLGPVEVDAVFPLCGPLPAESR